MSKKEITIGCCLLILGIIPGLIALSYWHNHTSIGALQEKIDKGQKIITARERKQQREIEVIEFMKGKGYGVVKQSQQVTTNSNSTVIGGSNRNGPYSGGINIPTSTTQTITQVITFEKK